MELKQLARGTFQQRDIVCDFAEQDDFAAWQAACDQQGEFAALAGHCIEREVIELAQFLGECLTWSIAHRNGGLAAVLALEPAFFSNHALEAAQLLR